MASYKERSGNLEFHYGWDDVKKEYWYKVYDLNRRHINGGLIDAAGSRSSNMPPTLMAEKLKQFNAPQEHVKKVLWLKKI